MNFILETFIKDETICDSIVEYFNNSPDKQPGSVGKGKNGESVVDLSIKRSTDLSVTMERAAQEPFRSYFREFGNVEQEYIEKYPYCNSYSGWRVCENPNIQKYSPTEGFFPYHTERTSSVWPISARHLVFMTYLNTVTDQGETEFFHQELKVKPEKGKTLVWPADWTHTHRGIPSPTQEKYILTGWISYVEV